jgi:cell division septation protein DedD
MPWPPNGDYYIFKEASIKVKAPNASGVYGLYNINHYVLIGESADIREALLRHERETGFFFGLYRPVGFTFEVCSPELRAERAKQLLAEYRPVLQVRDLFSLTRWRKDSKNPSVFNTIDGAAKNGAVHEATPAFIVNEPKDGGKFYFSRDQVVVLALAFAVTAISIGFLGVLTGKQLEATRIVSKETSPANTSINPPAHTAGTAAEAPTGEGIPYFRALRNRSDGQPTNDASSNPVELQSSDTDAPIAEQKRVAKDPVRTTAGKIPERADEPAVSAPTLPRESASSQPGKPEAPAKTWTVQVKASADKGSADVWMDRLKTKGYKAFVVEADIQGRTWYRVRVGSFDTRQEAEKLRQVLDSQEGFSDAFLTNVN